MTSAGEAGALRPEARGHDRLTEGDDHQRGRGARRSGLGVQLPTSAPLTNQPAGEVDRDRHPPDEPLGGAVEEGRGDQQGHGPP